MRTAVALLFTLLALPASAAAQEAWLRDYKDGVEAYNDGNLALAEEKLRSAKERGPEQSRRARTGGSLFTEIFIPDFYLGLISAQQGRHEQAVKLLEGALAQELVTQRQKADYQRARTTIDRSKQELAKLAEKSAPPPPPPTREDPKPTQTQPPAWLAEFQKAYDAGRAALRESRYADARTGAARARAVAGNQQSIGQADALRREIETAQDQHESQVVQRATEALRGRNVAAAEAEIATLAGLDSQHSALAGLRTQVEALRRSLGAAALIERTERDAIRLYFSGNYQESATALQRAVASGVTSPRIHLYLACSQAALALMADPKRRGALVEQARRQYASARPGQNDFGRDRRFISPRVLQLLEGG